VTKIASIIVSSIIVSTSKVSTSKVSSVIVSAIIVSAVPLAISIEPTVVAVRRIDIPRRVSVRVVVGIGARIPADITVRRRRVNRSHADSYDDPCVCRRWTRQG
jgi:hypothetical protein